eukprot:g27710.t2
MLRQSTELCRGAHAAGDPSQPRPLERVCWDTYLFAWRPYSTEPPLPLVATPEAKAFEAAQHILAEAEPHDAMGVPCDVSMRQLRRRFGCLTKLLTVAMGLPFHQGVYRPQAFHVLSGPGLRSGEDGLGVSFDADLLDLVAPVPKCQSESVREFELPMLFGCQRPHEDPILEAWLCKTFTSSDWIPSVFRALLCSVFRAAASVTQTSTEAVTLEAQCLLKLKGAVEEQPEVCPVLRNLLSRFEAAIARWLEAWPPEEPAREGLWAPASSKTAEMLELELHSVLALLGGLAGARGAPLLPESKDSMDGFRQTAASWIFKLESLYGLDLFQQPERIPHSRLSMLLWELPEAPKQLLWNVLANHTNMIQYEIDNNRGVLAVSNDDGDWANSNIRTCTYELFTNNQAIYAGMVFYVGITVTNPTNPLPKTDAENMLTIKLSGLGQYDPQGIAQPAAYDFPDAPFISLGEERTDVEGRNPAVLTKLQEELVQPYSFVRSCCGPNFETRRAEDFLRVFFYTTTYIGQNGYVLFDAPSGFNFDATCTARDLPERYYAFVARGGGKMSIGKSIPCQHGIDRSRGWWTGSQQTMRFNKFNDPALTSFYDLSWGMFDDVGPDIPVQLLSTRPTSLTNDKTEVIFFPITFQVDLETSLRVSAPVGFKWDPDPAAFFTRTNGTLEDWPRQPTVLNQNQLVFNTLSLKGNTQYGFRAKCDVPDFNPVNSANSFFIEFGYKSNVIQQRRFANVVEAPSIAALTNAEVTTLTSNMGIVVKGSPLTSGFVFSCPTQLVALPESAPFPSDLICVQQVASDNAPQITLKVNNINMPPGYYRWEMTAQNPPTRKQERSGRFDQAGGRAVARAQDPGFWTFGTYLSASDYPTTPVLDKELQATGFRIDNMMRDAWLTALAQERPLANRILTLRGPRGFVFDDNCLPYVESPPLHKIVFRPTKCTGVGREAQITIPSGLGRYSLYVFRIGVRSNPPTTPEWNKWSMNFNDESSDPFQGFTVWTFTNIQITAVGAMKTPRAGIPRTATPVTITFTPFNTVPAKPPNEQYGGMMRLTVPGEYEIEHNNLACEVQLFISDRSEVFLPTDYYCQVENTVKQLLYMAGDKSIRGAFSYTLIVWVFNPPTSTLASTWRMDTFQRFSAEPDTALDETEFTGYNVNNMLNIFQVVNTNNVLNGNTKVNDVDILLNFPDPMKARSPAVAEWPLSPESLKSLPEIFRILVVCGATGSGKTRIVQQLVEYFQLEVSSEQIVFEDDMAVCSHPALGDDYLEKLQAVGLNSVPSWMKAEKALSTGQQQRIRSAIRASSESKGILYDDFCCFVDQQNLGGNDFQHVFEDFVWTSSYSCAASIYRLVRDNEGLNYIIVATTRPDVIPYLGADIVIEAATGKIHNNPLEFAERKMVVKIEHEELKFNFGKGCSGWQGPLDSGWRVGALCGPSGSGKSVNLRNLGQEAKIVWKADKPVGEQVAADLLDVVLLPLPARQRFFHELSAGEKMQADLAYRLARPENRLVLADEFTSVLDRTLAARLCASVASYVRENLLQLVVATIQTDVVKHLRADWCFRSDYAELLTFSGPCECPEPPELPEVDYFCPPVRTFTLARLRDSKHTHEVFKGTFEEHHYLKQGLPLMWGLLVRDEQQLPVGFHAIAWQTGCGAPREARCLGLREMKARQKQVKGQQLLPFAPLKQSKVTTEDEVEHPRRCFSHVYVGGGVLLRTPQKRNEHAANLEQPSQEKVKKKKGRPRKAEDEQPKRPRGRPRKIPTEGEPRPGEPDRPTGGKRKRRAMEEEEKFRWVGGVQLAVTGEPGCTCNPLTSFCTIRWLIDESKDPAYPQNEDLHFKVATANPSKTPFLTDNYWKVAHMKGTVVKSSHIHRGWDVNPQLENVEVKLTGTKYAAGKISAIEVTFTPITDADTLKIEAIFPTQFNFDQSTVPLPYDIDSRSEGATLIINRGGFRAGVMTTIAINTVRLGRAGGQTRFNFITYNDDTMSEKRDEKLGFTGGFRLPGLISVVNAPVLRSQYQEAKAQFPVEAVQASERLLVTCQGQAKQSPFVVIGIGPIETSVEIDADGILRATLKPGRPATEVALQADTPYTIIMLVLPVQGTNTWRFDTSDGGALPTNTNDGELNGFSPVEQFVLGVEAVRSPPRAVVDVTLSIEVGNAIELIIVAPPSFLFDESAGGCGDMCLPGESFSGQRKTATIASPTGEPLTQLQGIKVRVLTPYLTPSSVTWFVEGRGQGAGTTVGWGRGPGFFVTQMAATSVMYPAVAKVAQAQIVFTFALNVNAGNQINIVAPPNFILTCSTEGALKQISLPGGKPSCIDDPLQITVDTTLTRDQYAWS